MSEPPAYGTPPQYGPAPGGPGRAAGLICPKCRGAMRTYERNGIHIDQCESCRGIFLDFGELEHLVQLEARLAPQPQAQQGYYDGPGWGHRGGRHYRKGGFSRLFFSS